VVGRVVLGGRVERQREREGEALPCFSVEVGQQDRGKDGEGTDR
jgi:hypothetical protein